MVATPAADQQAPVDTSTPAPVDTAFQTSASSPAPMGGGKYVVKAGDTLYRIAVTHYGSGKEWHKIVAANPGVSPQHLRVGQTLILP
jgi:5'-nucleotidase